MSEDTPTTQDSVHLDSSAQGVARIYAEALLDAAQAQSVAEEVLEQMDSLLRDVASADPLLRAFFGGGVVGRERRAEALQRALRDHLHPLLLNALLVLNDHDRSGLLPALRQQYRDLLEQRTGKMRVLVHSAVPLTEQQASRLVELMRQSLGRQPVLEQEVRPDLLGGLIVQVGDLRFDASVRTQIEIIRNQLIERSTHEIQTGRDRFSSANGD